MTGQSTQRLRALLAAPGLVQAPGAYDALTGRLIEAAGFPVCYMTGYGTAATYGVSDTGVIGFPEMLANASRIAKAIRIPLIADADTGYDDPAETTRAYQAAGVAGIQLEDQTWPKKCGHMEGKSLVPADAMIERIRAAVGARAKDGIVIVARTDAIAVEGFGAALTRAELYAEAGADVLFIEAPSTREQVEAIPDRLRQRPHFYNVAPKSPAIAAGELERIGYKLAIYPGIAFTATMRGVQVELETLRTSGEQSNLSDWRVHFDEWNAFLKETSTQ